MCSSDLEAKRDASVTNATPLIEEQLAAVNKNTPAWLWHSFDGKKSKIETNLLVQAFFFCPAVGCLLLFKYGAIELLKFFLICMPALNR